MSGVIDRNILLSNGYEMPRIGLGTFKATPVDMNSMVATALHAGLRLIDTASIYKNQEAIAEGLKESRIPRSQVFLTSKVSPYEQGRDRASAAIADILSKLDTNYLDLLLVHWPGAHKQKPDSPQNAILRMETWRVMEDFYRAGKLKAIGVSNFEAHHLDHILSESSIKPMVNQIEVHPRRASVAMRTTCQANHIAVTAYGSLGCGDLLSNPVVAEATEQCKGRSCAQVLLRWGLLQGMAVIPKSIRPERIASYSEDQLLSGWTKEEDELILSRLAILEDGHKYCWDSSLIH